MKMTRVRSKNSDLVVHVISSDEKELLMLSEVFKMASANPDGYHMLVDVTNSKERIVIVNDKIFNNIDETGLIKRENENPVFKFIDAHIIKWGIKKPNSSKPKPRPKNKGKRFKIKVE